MSGMMLGCEILSITSSSRFSAEGRPENERTLGTGSTVRVRFITMGVRDLPPVTGTINHDIGTSTPH